MAAPSSAQTSPSHTANKAPAIQPSMACGPPIALKMRGMVMNGPTPIMSIMLSAVALARPIPRMRPGDAVPDSVGDPIFVETLLATSSHHKKKKKDVASYVSTADRLSHSADSHTAAPPPAHLLATAGRMHIPCRCTCPCHIALAAVRPSAAVLRDHGRPAAALNAPPTESLNSIP